MEEIISDYHKKIVMANAREYYRKLFPLFYDLHDNYSFQNSPKITYYISLDYDDLVQLGMMGALNAYKKFNKLYKIPLDSYLTIKIRQYIVDGIREATYCTRNYFETKKLFDEAKRKILIKKGYCTRDDLIAELKLEDNLELFYKLEYITAFKIDMDYFPTKDVSIETRCEERIELKDAIFKLPNNEKKVIYNFYFKDKSLDEIGKELNISKSRVSQIHKKALHELKKLLTIDGYDPKAPKKSSNKLTYNTILKIKKWLKEGKYTQAEIAKKVDVTPKTISYIYNKKAWADV